MSVLRRLFLGCAFLLAASPLSACINDSEVGAREAEFNRPYRQGDSAEDVPGARPLALAGMGAGGLLLLGSLAYSVWRLRRR